MSRRDLTVPALTVPLVNDKLTKLAGVTQNLDDTGGLNASTISSGLVPLARGGTNVDLSKAGSATAFLAESALHVVSARSIVAADVPSLDASKITTGLLALARGGTNADLSATGGAKKVLQQLSTGAAITVAQLAVTDLSSLAAFVVWITNTAGTLQHKIVQDQDASTLPTYVGSLSGASASLSNTPSVGAGVDFTAGGGIDSGATRYFILNTAALTAGVCTYSCSMAYNDTQSGGGGLDFWPDLVQRSTNVNGTTRNRLAIEFRNRGTSVAQALTTANIPSGASFMVKILGFF